MRLELFDFDLPATAIAQEPARPRDTSRLLVMPQASGTDCYPPLLHHRFHQLPEHLRPGDVLVVNRTQVMPARLQLRKPTGGRVELLLVEPENGGSPQQARRFWAMGKPGRALVAGRHFLAPGGELLEVLSRHEELVLVQLSAAGSAEQGDTGPGSLWRLMQRYGALPLPPYIRPLPTDDEDRGDSSRAQADYQSVFAQQAGAVAAPTASLHFTAELVQRLRDGGVIVAECLLHVGPGTFLPVRPEHRQDIRAHRMHGEYYEVPAATGAAVKQAKASGRRVVAVGSTALRALETWNSSGADCGVSTLFCYPGYDFQVVDALITNFHLPRSTLLMLVSAFVGRQPLLAAYQEAITQGYRFYSYGDAMLLHRVRGVGPGPGSQLA